jgi:hypothetical protein
MQFSLAEYSRITEEIHQLKENKAAPDEEQTEVD